jgi:hypothetical protein
MSRDLIIKGNGACCANCGKSKVSPFVLLGYKVWACDSTCGRDAVHKTIYGARV